MANSQNTLSIDFTLPLKALNAGEFISRGEGMHPIRTIDSYEIIFVTEGVLELFEDEVTYCLEPDSALLLFPGKRHGGVHFYPPDLSFYWIHFDLNFIESVRGKNLVEVPKFVKIMNPIRMTEFFRRFLDDQESGNQNPVQGSLLIMQMLAEMSFTGAEASTSSVQLLDRAVRYVKLHLKEVSGTAEIAKALHCNPDYLGRKFKENFARTLTDEIHRQRINYAKKILLESVMNVAEVAMEAGFDDPVYFRKIFKRIAGIAPRAYRQQYSRVSVNTEYR
jgi:AraC-like DNA-binding protein